jgi:hypothetical protein
MDQRRAVVRLQCFISHYHELDCYIERVTIGSDALKIFFAVEIVCLSFQSFERCAILLILTIKITRSADCPVVMRGEEILCHYSHRDLSEGQ